MITGCGKSKFYNHKWFATLDGLMACCHLHDSPKAARKCARKLLEHRNNRIKRENELTH